MEVQGRRGGGQGEAGTGGARFCLTTQLLGGRGGWGGLTPPPPPRTPPSLQ